MRINKQKQLQDFISDRKNGGSVPELTRIVKMRIMKLRLMHMRTMELCKIRRATCDVADYHRTVPNPADGFKA
jgi:hypothetical protein